MRTKIYTVHENPSLAELSDRAVLVREGFSLWAFGFTLFWLVWQRLWFESLVFLMLNGMLGYAGAVYGFSAETSMLMQGLLAALLGFSAHDLKRAALARRGYAMTGVVAAESELAAERRFYDTVRV